MSLITTRSSPLTASLKRNRRFISKWLFQIYAVFVETPGIVGIRARWEFFYFFKLKFSDCPCRRSSKDRSTSWSSWGPVVPSLAPSRESAVSLGDTFYTSYLQTNPCAHCLSSLCSAACTEGCAPRNYSTTACYNAPTALPPSLRIVFVKCGDP